MNIWIPHTFIEAETMAALGPYKVNCVPMDDDRGYPEFLKARWEEGKTFINVEHDVVPWAGALESLWECDHRWCAFAYGDEIYTDDNHTPVFGCCKFSSEFMKKTAGIWDAMLAGTPNPYNVMLAPNPLWKVCDTWLRQWARHKGLLPVHQHFPPVKNL